MIVDLDRIRARHNAWYDDRPGEFDWGEEEGTPIAADNALNYETATPSESAMAFEIVRVDVPALIAEVERLRDVRVPELTAEIVRLDRARKRVLSARRVLRRANDNLLAELGRMKEENSLLKRRIEGLERQP